MVDGRHSEPTSEAVRAGRQLVLAAPPLQICIPLAVLRWVLEGGEGVRATLALLVSYLAQGTQTGGHCRDERIGLDQIHR